MFSAFNTTQSPFLDSAVLLAPYDSRTTPQTEEPMLGLEDIFDFVGYEHAHGALCISESQEPHAGSAVDDILPDVISTERCEEGDGPGPGDRERGYERDRADESVQPRSISGHAETCPSPWLEASHPHLHLPSQSTHEARADTRTRTRPSPPPGNTEAQIELEDKGILALLGWAPPNGSQVLDLDPTLEYAEMLPWYPPWLVNLLAPSPHARIEVPSPSMTLFATGGKNPTGEKEIPSTPAGQATEKHGKSAPRHLPPKRVVLGSVQARSSSGADQCTTGQASATSHPRISESRLHSSLPSTGMTTARTYPSAPRGGIPPHLARRVTAANIVRRAEQERERMQAMASGGSGGEGEHSRLETGGKAEGGVTGCSAKGRCGGKKVKKVKKEKVVVRGRDGEWEGVRVAKRTKTRGYELVLSRGFDMTIQHDTVHHQLRAIFRQLMRLWAGARQPQKLCSTSVLALSVELQKVEAMYSLKGA
ncbi:hypothetical protein BU15DRAFT_68531 [Melanogaster broomeanus]|nr:hypothetical protein BU15DRAFT_68531 [Melanogaster broomeanus]